MLESEISGRLILWKIFKPKLKDCIKGNHRFIDLGHNFIWCFVCGSHVDNEGKLCVPKRAKILGIKGYNEDNPQ